MTNSTRHSAFTLLELVIVMLIIATALAVAAPTLRGWSKGAALRDQTDRFLAVTRWARTQAVATATPHRVVIDASSGQYWVLRRERFEFVNLEGEFGQVFQLPDGFVMDFEKDATASSAASGPAEPVIDFSPLGKTDIAQVRLVSDRGQASVVACATPHDIFRRVTQPEVLQ